MQDVIHELRRLTTDIESRSDPLVGNASLVITLIEGGIARNVIPPSCTISIDRRILPAESIADVEREIEATLEPLRNRIDYTIEAVALAEAGQTDPSEGIVKTSLDARTATTGVRSEAKGFSACCDMYLLTNHAATPTIILGPGDLTQAHKTDEHIDLAELEKATELYRRIAVDWLAKKAK